MNAKYFSDIDGITTEIPWPSQMTRQECSTRFPGVKAVKIDSLFVMAGTPKGSNTMLPITRRIYSKPNPSLHVCNTLCMNGKHDGACECRCGGKNHGIGNLAALLTLELF